MKLKKIDYGFISLMIILMLVQLWKLQFSPGFEDEHFYITLGHRLSFGDSLFFDEWHITQLISVFLYPLYNLYVLIFKGTEGIVLGFRMFYVIFQSVLACVIYFKFRKYGIFVIFSVIAFMLYTPFNIMALSYNTMSIGFIILFLCILPNEDSHKQVLRFICAGIFYSLAVLNTPYLAVGYFIFSAFVLLSRKNKKFLCMYTQPRTWLYLSMGILITVLVFLFFVLSRATLSEIFSTIQYLIDPGHSTSMIMMIMINGYRLLTVFSIFLPLYTVLIAYAFINRENKKKARIVFNSSVLLTVVTIMYVCFFNKIQSEIGGFMVCLIPFSMLGLVTCLLIEDKRKYLYLYICLFVPFFHAFLIAISSNVGPRSLASPLIVSSIVTILFLGIYSKKNKKNNFTILIVICIFILNLLYFKVYNLYGYGTNWQFEYRVDSGPLKGLLVEKQYKNRYEDSMRDIMIINELKGYVVFISSDVWSYLASTNAYGGNSSLNSFYTKEEYLTCLDNYFKIHSNKTPLYIYVDKVNKAKLQSDDPWLENFKLLYNLKNGDLYVKE